MIDTIDRIVEIVFEAQGEMTLNQLCQPGVQEYIVQKTSESIEAEVEKWVKALWEIVKLEEGVCGD